MIFFCKNALRFSLSPLGGLEQHSSTRLEWHKRHPDRDRDYSKLGITFSLLFSIDVAMNILRGGIN